MREDKRKESQKIVLFVAITMAVFFLFPVYVYMQIGWGVERREALRAEIETHGPWAEQAVWVSADGGAYVLPPPDEPYAQPTAYFLIGGEWYDFEMICGPGCILWFSDRDAEFDTPQFKSNFKLEGDTFTLHIKRQNTDQIRPKRRTYVFTKAADDEQVLAALPFMPQKSE